MEFVGNVTFMVISPEPEVSAIFNLNLICDHVKAFKQTEVCSNQFSHLKKEKCFKDYGTSHEQSFNTQLFHGDWSTRSTSITSVR